jgi:hypothetical protein
MGTVALRTAIASCAFGLGLVLGPDAYGFCRTTTCPTCPIDPSTGCPTGGVPIFWPRSCVSFSLNVKASSQIDLATATQYAHEAFATWSAVRCDGEPLAIQAQDAFGPVECDHIEYNPIGANANVILFRDDEWPYPGVGNTLALTTVTYDSGTGEIHDADMEINGTVEFVTPGNKGIEDFDLLSIMTHEAGHFLGMAHTRVTDAVMQTTLPPRVVRTTLSDDDVAGVCAIYPPTTPKTTCDYAPLGGFSAQCGLDTVNGGSCSMAETPVDGDAPLSLLVPVAVAVVPWAFRSARRRPGRRSPRGR